MVKLLKTNEVSASKGFFMLLNKSSGEKIVPKTKFADTSWLKLKGLMFENQKHFDYALVFELPKESVLHATIHMLFVFFPIDAVFLDKNRQVVDIVHSLMPFTPSYAPKKPAKFIVELPAGKAAKIKQGDLIAWDSSHF